MDANFFKYASYRAYLKARYAHQKAVKPHFSARYLAKKAGLGSASHFGLVVSGRRKLSTKVARQLSVGLELDDFNCECLLASAALETSRDAKARRHWMERLRVLRQRAASTLTMPCDHVRVLSDLTTLKLYLLAQSQAFTLDRDWILSQLPATEDHQSVSRRIASLLESGLWCQDGREIKTVAPRIQTGDGLAAEYLRTTHENLVGAAQRALGDAGDRRVFGGQTFLFARRRLGEVAKRIERFKIELEAEFEDLASDEAYQVHIAFFELEPRR